MLYFGIGLFGLIVMLSLAALFIVIGVVLILLAGIKAIPLLKIIGFSLIALGIACLPLAKHTSLSAVRHKGTVDASPLWGLKLPEHVDSLQDTINANNIFPEYNIHYSDPPGVEVSNPDGKRERITGKRPDSIAFNEASIYLAAEVFYSADDAKRIYNLRYDYVGKEYGVQESRKAEDREYFLTYIYRGRGSFCSWYSLSETRRTYFVIRINNIIIEIDQTARNNELDSLQEYIELLAESLEPLELQE